MLLIDEYDSPLISAYEYHYYDEVINFYKVFGEALKTNFYLKMGIMTGIRRLGRIMRMFILWGCLIGKLGSFLDRSLLKFFILKTMSLNIFKKNI